MKRTVSLSSLYLKVQDDKHDSSDKFQSLRRKEETIKCLLNIPMMCAINDVQTIKEGVFTSKHTHVLTIKSRTDNIAIDLLFDAGKNLQEFYDWSKCVEEAKEINTSQINRLAEAKLKIHPIVPSLARRISEPSVEVKTILHKLYRQGTAMVRRKSSIDVQHLTGK